MPLESENEESETESSEPDDNPENIVNQYQKFNLTEDIRKLECQNELEYYKLFIDKEVITILVNQSNTYAEQIISKKVSKVLNNWAPTNIEEMYRFLGVLLWMGLDKKPKLADYWRRSDLYWSQASNVMTRNRFQDILNTWRFICPIQSIINILNDKFTSYVLPNEDMYINESKYHPYIKGRKLEITLLKLCLSGGYTYRTNIYYEEEKTKIILDIMSQYFDRCLTLYTDTSYTSLELARKLSERHTDLVGTMKKNNKDIPIGPLIKNLTKNEICHRTKDNVTIFKWNEETDQDIIMLTTKRNIEMVELSDDRGCRVVPKALLEFNTVRENCRAVDKISECPLPVSYVKWRTKVALELIVGASSVNAYHLFNLNVYGSNDRTFGTFRENLCLQLLSVGRDYILDERSSSAVKW